MSQDAHQDSHEDESDDPTSSPHWNGTTNGPKPSPGSGSSSVEMNDQDGQDDQDDFRLLDQDDVDDFASAVARVLQHPNADPAQATRVRGFVGDLTDLFSQLAEANPQV